MEIHKILPNFLIVGAARSGTTTLYHCLRQHPDIYMPNIKEPCFFTFYNEKPSFPTKKEIPFIINADDYHNLFYDGYDYKMRGEASTPYLFLHKETITNILNAYQNINLPKIVIILRNPVERAHSQYMKNFKELTEHLTFSEAINYEEIRIRNNEHFDYFYISRGYYYEQVKAYIENFREVKIILFNDLVSDPKYTINKLFEFLNVSNIDIDYTKKYNVSGKPRIKILNTLFVNENFAKNIIKNFLSENTREIIKNYIELFNMRKTHLNSSIRNNLIALYKDDIGKLEILIGRDLSSWLE